MANLRGSTFEKQTKDAFHRLEAFGEKRHGSSDHLTHSGAVADKRVMYLNDFATHLQDNGINTGKLNEYMHPDIMDRFLHERTADLSQKSAVDYARGWSSMVQGLEEKNITVTVDRAYFDDTVKDIKSTTDRAAMVTGRAINDTDTFISSIERDETRLFAETILDTGFRASEAYELITNPTEHIAFNGDGTATVFDIVGKGGQEYDDKIISGDLAVSILEKSDSIPSISTIRDDLRELDVRPHDLRYTYARDEFEERIAGGMDREQALKEVSEELNHHRTEITEYYLARA